MAVGGAEVRPGGPAKRRRRKEVADYLLVHQDRLEKLAQRCLNRVLLDQPVDPYEALLHQLSEHTQEGIAFSHLRLWPQVPGGLGCEVVADARGSRVAAHRATLPQEVLARYLALASKPPAEGAAGRSAASRHASTASSKNTGADALASKGSTAGGAVDAEAVEAQQLGAAAKRLGAALQGVLQGAKILEFAELERRLQGAIASKSSPCGEDTLALVSALGGVLTVAAGCLLDSSAVEALRSGLVLRQIEPGPPLLCQGDLEVWQHRWPELWLPAVEGTMAHRRLCVGVTLWAALLPEAATGDMHPAFVDEVARRGREALQAEDNAANVDIEDPQEVPLPEPDEFCPPTNAVAVALALAGTITAKLSTECPSLPPGDNFAPALESFRRTLEAIVPSYTRRHVPGRSQPSGPAACEAKGEEELVEEGPVPLAEQQWRGSVYCALELDADAAFDPSSGKYTFAEGVPAKSQAELIEHYATLCHMEPLLRVLVAPLSAQDPGGIEALRARLPPEVRIIQQPSHTEQQGPARTSPEGSSTTPVPGSAGDVEQGLGHPRDLNLTPLGLLADCESHHGLYVERSGLYDFSASGLAARLPMLEAYMDVSFALPEPRRFVLLPAGSGSKELPQHLQALDSQVHRLIVAAYRQKAARDGRQKMLNLSSKQWREGLRRLGYPDVEQYANPLFQFLDVSNNGSISTGELKALQDIRGPASLQELDEFRIWLCTRWQQRRMSMSMTASTIQQQQEKVEPGPGSRRGSMQTTSSPLTQLWLRMDTNGSGLISFGEFRRGLRKMRHPAAVEGGDGKLQELFMCLDLTSDGSINETEFHCLGIHSAKFQLDRVIQVRDFLKGRFGTLKAAFKAMDENRSGTLTKEEWMRVMEGKQGYAVPEDCSVCFQFFDKEGANILSGKDFELLGTFDQEKLLDDAQALYDHLLERHGSLEAAFTTFENRPGSAKHHSPNNVGLDVKDFLAGCKASQFQGASDLRLLFNFLDAMHVGRVGRSEFSQLGKVGALDALQERTEQMQGAISSLKAFVSKLFEGAFENSEDVWERFHKELRNATHGDLDLC